jgi:hypothetical protein
LEKGHLLFLLLLRQLTSTVATITTITTTTTTMAYMYVCASTDRLASAGRWSVDAHCNSGFRGGHGSLCLLGNQRDR